MLWVQFRTRTTQVFVVGEDTWVDMGAMVLWLLLDRETLNDVERCLYVMSK